MTEPSRGVLRVARTLAWTLAAGGLSTGAHLAAGGGLPIDVGAASFVPLSEAKGHAREGGEYFGTVDTGAGRRARAARAPRP